MLAFSLVHAPQHICSDDFVSQQLFKEFAQIETTMETANPTTYFKFVIFSLKVCLVSFGQYNPLLAKKKTVVANASAYKLLTFNWQSVVLWKTGKLDEGVNLLLHVLATFKQGELLLTYV